MNAPRPASDTIYRKTLDAQVTHELSTRTAAPKLDYDRLRAMQPLLLDKLAVLMRQASKEPARQKPLAELGVIVGAVKEQFVAVEQAHAAWLGAAGATQLWSVEATTQASALFEVARGVRRTVSDRVSPDSDRDVELRRRIGVGLEVARSAPLAVADFAQSQLLVLRDPADATRFEEAGLDVGLFIAELEAGLKRMQAEMVAGPGQRRGEARVQRDAAQRRLEVLLSRAAAKLHAAVGLPASEAFEALLPRPAMRKAGEGVDPVVEPVDDAPVVPVSPVAPPPNV